MSARSILRIVNQTRERLLADRGELAGSFWSRGRGLMGRESLPVVLDGLAARDLEEYIKRAPDAKVAAVRTPVDSSPRA